MDGMNHNDAILDRLRGIPMKKGTWKDKFDPTNPNKAEANDNEKPVKDVAIPPDMV